LVQIDYESDAIRLAKQSLNKLLVKNVT